MQILADETLARLPVNNGLPLIFFRETNFVADTAQAFQLWVLPAPRKIKKSAIYDIIIYSGTSAEYETQYFTNILRKHKN